MTTERIDAMSMPEPNSGCWLWLGGLSHGYGVLDQRGAHCISYEHHIGPIPDGLELDHKCRTRACVNPWHLEPVTHAENIRRAYRTQTHCKRGHPLSGDNLTPHRDGRRQCRACKYESVKRYRAKIRSENPNPTEGETR